MTDRKALRILLNKKTEDELRAYVVNHLPVEHQSGMPGKGSSPMALITWLIEYHERRVRMPELVQFAEEE